MNEHEPKPPQGPVNRPETLSSGAVLVWNEIALTVAAMGLLTVADVAAFSTLCELQASFRLIVAGKDTKGHLFTLTPESDAPAELYVSIDNLLKAERDTAAALRPYYERFGLDPVGRARIVVTKKGDEPKSKWAGVLG